ncbi:hypothetical protein MMC09_006362 [Bachmanniomyces sp. S44760]|nr:hypothetical protein [Bachmanniomyces sp. S44760]
MYPRWQVYYLISLFLFKIVCCGPLWFPWSKFKGLKVPSQGELGSFKASELEGIIKDSRTQLEAAKSSLHAFDNMKLKGGNYSITVPLKLGGDQMISTAWALNEYFSIEFKYDRIPGPNKPYGYLSLAKAQYDVLHNIIIPHIDKMNAVMFGNTVQGYLAADIGILSGVQAEKKKTWSIPGWDGATFVREAEDDIVTDKVVDDTGKESFMEGTVLTDLFINREISKKPGILLNVAKGRPAGYLLRLDKRLNEKALKATLFEAAKGMDTVLNHQLALMSSCHEKKPASVARRNLPVPRNDHDHGSEPDDVCWITNISTNLNKIMELPQKEQLLNALNWSTLIVLLWADNASKLDYRSGKGRPINTKENNFRRSS